MTFALRSLNTLTSLMVLSLGAPAQDWSNWRGPARNGASTTESAPLRWSASENIVWRVALPAWGGATPIVHGDRVFVTTPSATPEAADAAAPNELGEPGGRTDSGRRGGRGRGQGGGRDPGGDDMLLLCIARADGRVLWRTKLDSGNALHRKGNHASPSPVADDARVYTVTGNGTVSAHTLEGEHVWHHNLQTDYGGFGLMWGYASSPVLHDGQLIVQVLHGNNTDDPSYLVAYDAATGALRWRVERETDAPRESPDAYTTPLVRGTADGAQVIVTGGDYVTGHDPATGAELWRLGGLNPQKAPNYRIVASALCVPDPAGDWVVVPTRVRPLTAFRLGPDGQPIEAPIAWQWNERGAPDVPSPTTDGTHLFMVDDGGMVTCLDVRTGAALWGPERTLEGTVSASPTLANGMLYVTNEEGVTVVLRAGPTFERIAVNELDGSYTLSTPVAADGHLYVRTGEALYCIGAAPQAPGGAADQASDEAGATRDK
ncbi:MAG: PQQ-binding-like beta-propeller repeat protein [Planctomycetota bacterium]